MGKPHKHPKPDFSQIALAVVRKAAGIEPPPEPEPEPSPVDPNKNPAAVALGRLGGKKGGKARAESLTPDRRKEIAKAAAAKRWGKKTDSPAS